MKYASSGEPIEYEYTTWLNVTVLIPKSEMNFYDLLHHLRQENLIDDFGHRTYELQFLENGFPLVT